MITIGRVPVACCLVPVLPFMARWTQRLGWSSVSAKRWRAVGHFLCRRVRELHLASVHGDPAGQCGRCVCVCVPVSRMRCAAWLLMTWHARPVHFRGGGWNLWHAPPLALPPPPHSSVWGLFRNATRPAPVHSDWKPCAHGVQPECVIEARIALFGGFHPSPPLPPPPPSCHISRASGTPLLLLPRKSTRPSAPCYEPAAWLSLFLQCTTSIHCCPTWRWSFLRKRMMQE